MKNASSPLERSIKILELLKEHTWITAGSLAKDLGVSKRTILRYMRQIDMAFGGYPIFETSNAGYRLDRAILADVWPEREKLISAAAILSSPYSCGKRFPKNNLENFFSSLQSRIQVENQIPETILRPILNSFVENRICIIKYKSKENFYILSVLPLRLVSDNGIHYLLAKDHASSLIKLFAIDKINSITSGYQIASIKETQILLNFIDSAWGIQVSGKTNKISFEVDDDIRHYFERRPLHQTQQNHTLASGELSISLVVHNIDEFDRWAYRFGCHVKNLKIINI